MEAQTKKPGLAVGEKYLSISLLGTIKLAAFKNKDKKTPQSPDYVGNGVAIWVSTKQAAQEAEIENVLV